jgi:hypothetical protein
MEPILQCQKFLSQPDKNEGLRNDRKWKGEVITLFHHFEQLKTETVCLLTFSSTKQITIR